ncbi:MAG: hypothetical protein RQ757_04175 [Pseudomonadales bacterium]|nr:hypothetical protein [Pseudomonadales bacterium]
MAITTFDTHKFVRRLEDAGMPLSLAEVQAEVLTEAFNVNLDSLVTKDYLAAQFAEQKAYMDTRLAEERAYMDTRFAEEFSAQNTRWEKRFAQLESKVDSNHRVFIWSQAIIMTAVILPYLERLLTT